MKNLYFRLIAAILISPFITQAQSVISKQHADLDNVIAPGTTVELLSYNYLFVEGPLWTKEGFIIFSDLNSSKIHQWPPVAGDSIYLSPSTKSNGLAKDKEGVIHFCSHETRSLSRLEANKTITILADSFDNKKLNSPNDLVFRSSDSSIYFTDPPYGLSGSFGSADKQLSYQGVYRYYKGNLQLLESTLYAPNGIAFSPDEKYLYISNRTSGGTKQFLRYEVNPDGTIKNKTTFSLGTGEGDPDGVKVDEEGNIFVAGPGSGTTGSIQIFSPAGVLLGKIIIDELSAVAKESPSNFNWGGADRKTLYITARKGLYKINTVNPGYVPFVSSIVSGNSSTATLEDDITITPNPASENITLNIPGKGNAEVQIFDTAGKPVISKKIKTGLTTVHIGSLAPGSYTVQLSYDKKVIRKRLVVIK
jgi:gluconolactonase